MDARAAFAVELFAIDQQSGVDRIAVEQARVDQLLAMGVARTDQEIIAAQRTIDHITLLENTSAVARQNLAQAQADTIALIEGNASAAAISASVAHTQEMANLYAARTDSELSLIHISEPTRPY